ncbi:hypothetical protein [Corynebacterium crudilactis]|uniref:Uncharacterized protein n=1 Tax=Corynebacterium crudilactis TaxID=1652495 RepID=A0A172QT49_9CORY|nr:hypothetical protein [Corynebacterium crudilactis]ANE03873.1 hypothetical protein ccrud_06375 [Corynebacterium crudilactis]
MLDTINDQIQIVITSVNEKLTVPIIAGLAVLGLLSGGGAYLSYDTSISSEAPEYQAPAQQ